MNESSVEFERIEQWLNLVAPAVMRDASKFNACDIASMSEVSPAKREMAPAGTLVQ
jgi:hypothetical protein